MAGCLLLNSSSANFSTPISTGRCYHSPVHLRHAKREQEDTRFPVPFQPGTSPGRGGNPHRRSGILLTQTVPPGCKLRSEEHTSELQSRAHIVCRLLLEKTKQ